MSIWVTNNSIPHTLYDQELVCLERCGAPKGVSRWPNGGVGGVDDRPRHHDATSRVRHLRLPGVPCLRVEYENCAVESDLQTARAAAGSKEVVLTCCVAILLNTFAILLQACAVHFYGSHTTDEFA